MLDGQHLSGFEHDDGVVDGSDHLMPLLNQYAEGLGQLVASPWREGGVRFIEKEGTTRYVLLPRVVQKRLAEELLTRSDRFAVRLGSPL